MYMYWWYHSEKISSFLGEFKQLKDQLNALEKDHEKKIEEINKEWQQKMTENLKRAKEGTCTIYLYHPQIG